jgi:hypothetical protein
LHGRFRHGVRQPESQQAGQNATPRQLSNPTERQPNQGSNIILPSYLDNDLREHFRQKIPNKEFLREKGWDSFAEYALDISGYLPKPYDPAIPPDNIEALDDNTLLSIGVEANVWEETVINTLEAEGNRHLIPQFNQQVAEYRQWVKATVDAWRQSGLL